MHFYESCIWLARNSSCWSNNTSLITIKDTNIPAAGRKNTNTFRESQTSNKVFLSSEPTRNLRKCDQHTKLTGFFIKGSTSYKETKTVDSESVLVLQLLCYNNFEGAVIKNNTRVNCCSETLRLPIQLTRKCLYLKNST